MAEELTTPTPIVDGRYEVLETLGTGSFGHTLLAREVNGGRQVAIKTLHPEKAEGFKTFELFQREATVLRELRHHGVPAIYDSFQARWGDGDAAFLVMEYIAGPTLERLIEDGHTFSSHDVLSIFLELAAVLQYLHERLPPILHRDIKPSNIILRDGRTPVLVDFGAVRNVFRAPSESGSTVVGTYGYMPYEQYMGQATPASDLYALGATLLHLLTGRAPSEFLSAAGRIEVPEAVPGGPRIRNVLVQLLAPAPTDRLPSAAALRTALLRTAESGELSAPVPVVRSNLAPHAAQVEETVRTLPPAPRELTGETRRRFEALVFKPWLMLDSGTPGALPGRGSLGVFVLLSVISVGVVPLIYWISSRAQRNRIKPYFQRGHPAVGVLQSLNTVRAPAGEQLTRVTYEFEADGAVHRGADQVLPRMADRWRVGDAIAVLYLPDRDYDSIVMPTK